MSDETGPIQVPGWGDPPECPITKEQIEADDKKRLWPWVKFDRIRHGEPRFCMTLPDGGHDCAAVELHLSVTADDYEDDRPTGFSLWLSIEPVMPHESFAEQKAEAMRQAWETSAVLDLRDATLLRDALDMMVHALQSRTR